MILALVLIFLAPAIAVLAINALSGSRSINNLFRNMAFLVSSAYICSALLSGEMGLFFQ